MALVYINGEFFPPEEAKISVFDHGFLYGDGVFEGIRVYNGRVFKLDEHLQRLYRGAKAIMLKVPQTPEQLKQTVLGCVSRSGLRDPYIRLVISRGKGDLGLDPNKCSDGAGLIIIVDKIALYPRSIYEEGLRMITVMTRRNLHTATNPAIKSLNYLNNIIARLEVSQAGYMEGLMLNQEGYAAEATGDNIFIYRDGRLITPPVNVGILQGITRDVVIDLARQMGLETREERFTLYDIYTADECFLTGTAAEIVPVVELDGRQIGDGRPGEKTRQLTARFHEITQSEGMAL
ncbi:MAG: branched-chain-amino-acid transaminase [Armatimonadetes bacterium]|nr:branched-chain-amino-acid transaminase [Armatimonadota bacterium]NIM24544.1 branched-chain-amino-acid transaminase [Armatimonadota bacterium]NIM68418.1 branched-chain-amino-acid transaminase [Armatimonadota bacterium]NIM76804.1 branched-chain-amino-acid transaminase [Armatimonadota bacterium]NIN06617.1 branched-chain-amino-acid transaminase [Armatimonadota bacterium]